MLFRISGRSWQRRVAPVGLVLLPENRTMPLLAQSASSIDSSTFIDKVGMLTRPQELLDSLIELHAIFGILVMAVGILCIFQGYRWHRWIVVLLALLLPPSRKSRGWGVPSLMMAKITMIHKSKGTLRKPST